MTSQPNCLYEDYHLSEEILQLTTIWERQKYFIIALVITDGHQLLRYKVVFCVFSRVIK